MVFNRYLLGERRPEESERTLCVRSFPYSGACNNCQDWTVFALKKAKWIDKKIKAYP